MISLCLQLPFFANRYLQRLILGLPEVCAADATIATVPLQNRSTARAALHFEKTLFLCKAYSDGSVLRSFRFSTTGLLMMFARLGNSGS